MFETMTGFLWFFFIMLAAICWGIWHEEKLVRFERAVWIGFWQTVKDWAADKLQEVRA